MEVSNNIFLGSELKLNVSIEPIGTLTMDDYDFVVEVYCSNQKVLNIPKSQAIRVDEENYVVLVDTKVIGTGRIKCKVTAQIPDADFSDSYRTEVVIIDTELDIIKHL